MVSSMLTEARPDRPSVPCQPVGDRPWQEVLGAPADIDADVAAIEFEVGAIAAADEASKRQRSRPGHQVVLRRIDIEHRADDVLKRNALPANLESAAHQTILLEKPPDELGERDARL